ncbi:MAG: PhnD/SsuA/transferrin family substrate-binding protein [Pseudomonadota bacterium]
MTGLASLPMYDRPELRDAYDRFWHLVRRDLDDAPDHLTSVDDAGGTLWDLWRHPELVLSQTCGLPYRHSLHRHVTLVGTPDYGLEGCAPGYYRSVIVARQDDPRDAFSAFDGACLALNDPLSQSGWAAPAAHAQDAGIGFGGFVETGAHAGSARAVAEGRADLAALDAHSWRLMCRFDDWTQALRVIDTTAPTPGLPFVTANAQASAMLSEAIAKAIEDLQPEDRDALCLKGILCLPAARYLAQPLPPAVPGTLPRAT